MTFISEQVGYIAPHSEMICPMCGHTKRNLGQEWIHDGVCLTWWTLGDVQRQIGGHRIWVCSEECVDGAPEMYENLQSLKETEI